MSLISSIARVKYQSLGIILFLCLWEVIISNKPSYHSLIPLPSELPKAFWIELQSGLLISNLLSSCLHIIVGIIIGSTLGIAWGLIIYNSIVLARMFSIVHAVLRPIPPIAWIPFVLVLLGSGTMSAIFIVLIGVFWTTFVTTLSAARSIDPCLLELAKIYKINKQSHLLFKIIIPASLPGIMAGIRTALGQGWSLVVAAELLGSPGIGQRMWEAAGVLANEVLVIYMFLIALVFTLSDRLFLMLDRRLFRWRSF